jgi:hypothetical protein
MSRRKSEPIVFSLRMRIALGFVGLLVMSDGLRNLLKGNLEYPNNYRAAVFAPFALLIGALAIVVAILQGRRN